VQGTWRKDGTIINMMKGKFFRRAYT
jgi:hypothetical protein